MNLHKLLSFEQGRIIFFETLTKHPENWQQNPTPLPIVRKMLDKTSLDDKKILVLFNIEFLQVLVEERKINPENIYYIADNDLEYLSAIKIFKVQSYKISDFTVPALKNLIVGLDMKFDLVFSNPPYNSYIDLKIITENINKFDELICIHPSPYIIKNDEGLSPVIDSFKTCVNNKIKSIEWVGAFESFQGVQNPTPLVILHYDKTYNSDSIAISYCKENLFGFYDDDYFASGLDEVTVHGSKYKNLVKPFYEKIVTYSSKHGSVMDLRISNPSTLDNSKFHCQLKQLMGNTNVKDRLYGRSFFCFVNRDNDVAVEYNPDGSHKMSKSNNFQFDTQQELENFVNYLKTDFARFCLHFVKFNKNLSKQFFSTTPLLDFKESWDDKKLYEMFEISEDLQKHIEIFLPDFHGIRN